MTDFEKNWINDNAILLQQMYPKVSRQKLDKILKGILKKNIKQQQVILRDTYKNKEYSSDTLQLTEFCKKIKPLTAGNGVLMDRDGRNPAIKMLDRMKEKRNYFKAEMKKQPPDSYEFDQFNLFQGNEKVKMNAWYGINGAPTSLFFNLECATAITGKGRHLISTATCAFDMFLGGHLIFLDMDDCLMYIKNIIKEEGDRKFKDKKVLDSNVTKLDVLRRLWSLFENKYDYNAKILEPLIDRLSQENLNRIYYKNNLYEFCRNSIISDMVYDFSTCIDVYINPDEKKTPAYLQEKLNVFWDYCEEYVFYRWQLVDKVYRVQYKERKSVLVIDTDSNMIHIDPWLEFVKNEVIPYEEWKDKNLEDFNHVLIYTMCNVLAKMIRTTLWIYLGNCNVKKENRKRLDMKNEYLFSRMLISDVKKNYASIIEFKEGKPMFGKPDVKGLPINKSSTNRVASKRFKQILEHDILKADKIKVIDILVKLKEFENEIRQSLRAGEQTFLKPINVKDVGAYADPLSNGGYRGAMLWNELYPDMQITLPDSFFLVKLTLTKPSDLDKVSDPVIREKIQKFIFESPEQRIKSKGAYILGIPRGKMIPEWAVPCIAEDLIVEDTMSAFMGVIRALGVTNIYQDSSSNKFSNYITL